HVEAAGFGRAWTDARHGAWVVRRHEITYRTPAVYGDELELTTRAVSIKGARGFRDTTIIRVSDGAPIADVHTEWVWVHLPDGRPARPPEDLVRFFTPESEET
ncbi:MAG TPA: acyl-CoA thioesterase, partial [Chloroflexota bacterium]|nr:acyl-CoA thioesterase [Chloroflexota bacterium]